MGGMELILVLVLSEGVSMVWMDCKRLASQAQVMLWTGQHKDRYGCFCYDIFSSSLQLEEDVTDR
jgi:hypothetical protein